jgi:hypothetical protein
MAAPDSTRRNCSSWPTISAGYYPFLSPLTDCFGARENGVQRASLEHQIKAGAIAEKGVHSKA